MKYHSQLFVVSTACLLIIVGTWSRAAAQECSLCPRACGEGCEPFVNIDGCYSCTCTKNDATCATVKCAAGYTCALYQVECIMAPCLPVAGCLPLNESCSTDVATDACLPPALCIEGCNLFEDCNGCYHCICEETCAAVLCPAGTECKIAGHPNCSNCRRRKCPRKPMCIPIVTDDAGTATA